MSHQLPTQPDLEHLKKQAKALLRHFRQSEPEAIERFRSFSIDSPVLADSQHVIAREYGFESWPKLKAHVESILLAQNPAGALTAAVKANDATRVREVLERHPELKSKIDDPLPDYSFGTTALLGAVQRTNREMVDVLLRAGADINARSHWWAGSFGVLDEAAPEFAPLLIERGAVIDVHAAARLGMLEKVIDIVSETPAAVHARGGDGQTPLHFASTVEIANYLLDHGADIDARDIDHESTAAQYMLRVTQKRHYPRDRQDIVRYLITRGCQTDILMAAALGNMELVRKHLDADPGCIRMSVSDQYFPKQDPRSGGTIYIWVFGWHATAHLIARDFGHEDVFRFLMARSPEEQKLALACELGDEALFGELLARRPNLAQTLSEDDRSKLASAAQNNNTGAVRLMLAAGWPVDVEGQYRLTPLHWAAWHGNADMLREILRYDPQLEKTNEYEITALGSALHGSENGWHRDTGDYAATVEALLAAGAKAPELTDDLEASEAAFDALREHAAGSS